MAIVLVAPIPSAFWAMKASERKTGAGIVMARLRDQIAGDPARFVENLADRLTKDLGKTDPPFQTEAYEYARLAGAKVIEADIRSAGLMSCFRGRIVIEVRRKDPPERKSYTVCHEVGHIEVRRAAKLLPGVGRATRHSTNVPVSRAEEEMVEQFAANALMPRDVFCNHARKLAPSLENAMLLAKLFRTSLGATLRRAVSLGAWNCAIMWGIPEKMGDDRWAVRIHELRSSVRCGLRCPQHKYVWWAGKEVADAFGSPSVVKEAILIDDREWTFEGLREWHYTDSGERENRVMAMLLPPKHLA